MQTITACYGVICADYVLSIESSGLPVQLFASLDQSSNVDSATITADETITVSAYAIDQYGNLVTNEVISFHQMVQLMLAASSRRIIQGSKR